MKKESETTEGTDQVAAAVGTKVAEAVTTTEAAAVGTTVVEAMGTTVAVEIGTAVVAVVGTAVKTAPTTSSEVMLSHIFGSCRGSFVQVLVSTLASKHITTQLARNGAPEIPVLENSGPDVPVFGCPILGKIPFP